jgi:DnaJ-class molecular chaperone
MPTTKIEPLPKRLREHAKQFSNWGLTHALLKEAAKELTAAEKVNRALARSKVKIKTVERVRVVKCKTCGGSGQVHASDGYSGSYCPCPDCQRGS